jgi:hypothetical protein
LDSGNASTLDVVINVQSTFRRPVDFLHIISEKIIATIVDFFYH